jgi:hypothetical protein
MISNKKKELKEQGQNLEDEKTKGNEIVKEFQFYKLFQTKQVIIKRTGTN